jgi:hypothetical protein
MLTQPNYIEIISQQLNLQPQQVKAVLELIAE